MSGSVRACHWQAWLLTMRPAAFWLAAVEYPIVLLLLTLPSIVYGAHLKIEQILCLPVGKGMQLTNTGQQTCIGSTCNPFEGLCLIFSLYSYVQQEQNYHLSVHLSIHPSTYPSVIFWDFSIGSITRQMGLQGPQWGISGWRYILAETSWGKCFK